MARPNYKDYIDRLTVAYVEENKPIYQVAQEFNLQEMTVSNWLKKSGVVIKKSQDRRSAAEQQEISQRISEKKMGVPRGTKTTGVQKKEFSTEFWTIKEGREGEMSVCPLCGREYQNDKYEPRKTCSPYCQNVSIRMQNEEKRQINLCGFCGKKVAISGDMSSEQKFCDNVCYNEYRKAEARSMRICPVCGKEFPTYKRLNQETCSYGCASKYQPYIDKRPEMVEKRIATSLERYGTPNPTQRHYFAGTVDILSSRESLQEYLGDRKITTTQLADELGCSPFVTYERLKKYDLWDLVISAKSTGETQVKEFLSSIGVETVSTKSIIFPYEIDLYSKEHKIGVEYNGDYWHSEKVRTEPLYHRNKSFLAQEKGVFIYHVFEYEWGDLEKRERIKSQLRNLFGKNTRRIYGRKTEVREISPFVKDEFLKINHVQSNDRSSIKLGLFSGDELVSVMTFVKPRFNKNYEWELSRFCSLADTTVIGGASKLFKYFLRNYDPKTVLSYSDITKTRGTVYESLGFKMDHISDPGYVWTNFREVLTRYKTQMENERQTMTDRGYARLYDCGNRVYVWTKPLGENDV